MHGVFKKIYQDMNFSLPIHDAFMTFQSEKLDKFIYKFLQVNDFIKSYLFLFLRHFQGLILSAAGSFQTPR